MFPVLLNDETLYALGGRIHRWSGRSNGTQTSMLLFGTAHAGLNQDFPAGLAEFCRRTDGAYGDPGALAMEATTLPYYLRFHGNPRRRRALETISSPSAERLKFELGLPASLGGSRVPLRACPECVSADRRDFGIAYWHRAHHLPGAYMCATHDRVRLRQSYFRIDGCGKSVFVLPDDKGLFGVSQEVDVDAAGQVLLQQMTTLAESALHRDLPRPFSPQRMLDAYRHGLKDQGLLTRGGFVRAGEFLDKIERRYQRIFHLAPYSVILSKIHLEGMLRLVRKPRTEFHTAEHLQLIHFLFGSWEAFCEVYAWESEIASGEESSDSDPILPRKEAYDPRVLQVAALMNNDGLSLAAASAQVGLDIGTAMRQIEKYSLAHIQHRPKVVTADIRNAIIDGLLDGYSQRALMKQFQLSRATIDRICHSSLVIQKAWKTATTKRRRGAERQKLISFLEANPLATRADWRATPGSGFSWLKRYDREWVNHKFSGRMPKQRVARNPGQRKPRVNWEARDQACLDAMLLTAEEYGSGPTKRISVASFVRQLPSHLGFAVRLELLPKSKLFAKHLVEQLKSPRF